MFIFLTSVYSQKYINPIDEQLIRSHYIDENGEEIIQVTIPGSPPPEVYKAQAAALTSTAVVINDVPALSWSFGCTATSAAMLAGFYDRQGYHNMYAGPTNSGLFPLTNAIWGTATINGEVRALCPLSATRNGLDGRTTRGHVDDFWIEYGNNDDDPYITNGWIAHSYEDCTADYMKTNQSEYGNSDGSTTYYFHPSGGKYSGTDDKDGPYGFQQFIESRNYTLENRFSQTIVGYDGNTTGFSFNDYVAEIDANRPVMIHLIGHTTLGVGYDFDTQTVYLHDTWDYNTHSMIWGGEYQDRQHIAVSVFELTPVTIIEDHLTVSNTTFSSENNCVNAQQTITVAGDEYPVTVENEASINFIAGQSIRFLPGFHAEAGSYVNAWITTTDEFCNDLPAPIMAAEPLAEKSAEIEKPQIEEGTLKQPGLKVYPNPNNGHFTIKLENIDSETRVLMYSSVGQAVYDVTMTEKSLSVELPDLQRGIYFIKAINNQKQFDQKIVVQ